MMRIIATGLNHHTAPVELRERFALRRDELPEALQLLYSQPGIREAVILSTCNRVELYTVEEEEEAPDGASASFFQRYFDIEPSHYMKHLYQLDSDKAVRHLFSVAGSLDSMIVGEPQILGQVKEFFLNAQAAGTCGRILNALFSRALGVGKRIRSETGIGQLAVSVPYAAVELARKVFDSLDGKSVSLVGRGEMSEVTALNLKRFGVKAIYAVNRDMDNAIQFAERIQGLPQLYDESLEFLLHTDIVVASTRAPHPVITKDALQRIMARRRNRLLLLIDISVPRVIDPAVEKLPNVYLFNIDHLETMVAENTRLRLEEARKAAPLIEEQVDGFMEWLASLNVVPTIRAFREHLETLRSVEVSRVLKDYQNFTPEQRELVEEFSRALINKIGHLPTVKLKAAQSPERARHLSSILRHLFDLESSDKR